MTCILFPKVVNSGLKRSMMTSSRLRLRGWVKSPTEQTKPLGDVGLAKYLSKPKRKFEPIKTWWWCIRKPLSGRSTTDIKIFNQCKSWFTKHQISFIDFCVHLGTVKGWKFKKYEVQLLCCYLTHDNKEIGKYIDHLYCTYR